MKEEKLLDEKYFYSSLKVRKTDDNGKKLGGHIGDDDYLTCNKIWNKLTWEKWVIIVIIIWKNMFCY